ncbi:MAG: prenyltransferase/squalene oxidase repeat-containing protein [Planctomycetota bacterium]
MRNPIRFILVPLVLVAALVLLPVFPASLPAAPTWHDSLAAGRRAAAGERKPILCVILSSGQRASAKLTRDLSKNRKLTTLLDRFVLVKLDRAKNAALVKRYNLKYSPATVFFTPGGAPLKTIVGGVSVSRYASEMQAALDKYEALLRPKRPKTERRETPSDDTGPELRHSGSCPDGCEHCAPVVDAALAWLLKQQGKDGRFAKPKAERITKSDDGREVTRSIDHVDVALSSTAGLALIAAGARPGEDRRGRALAKADAFVTSAVRKDGVICDRTDDDYMFLVHANFETALGTVFLAEMEKLAPDPARHKALARVRDYFEKSQDPASGAWGYGPDFRSHSPRTRRGYRLLATTHCVLTALNHLARAGLEVDDGVRRRAVKYLLACRGRDGAFTYRAEFRGLPGYPGATAGAYFALSRSGLVAADELEGIFARYRRDYRRFELYRPLTTTIGKHWWFFLLQTALAMNDRGPAAFDDFQRGFRDRLVRAQQPDGHFEDPDGNGGHVFATSIAVLALSMGRDRLPIAAGRAEPPVTALVPKPKYLVPPHAESRVKVFPHGGGYLADLVVWVDGPADRAYFESLGRGIEGANRVLFDVTDGQMRMHRVVLTADPAREKDADILITKGFYDREVNPRPWAHGITRVSKRTEIRGGKNREGARIGDWIMFPYHGRGTADVIRWDDSRFVHVLAHELCHYLFGLRDEYHATTGESFCDCIMGKRRATELCREETHTDDRQDAACWTLAKRLYPALTIPTTPDPGPWRPARPIVTMPK